MDNRFYLRKGIDGCSSTQLFLRTACFQIWCKIFYPPPHLKQPDFQVIFNCNSAHKIAISSTKSLYFQGFTLYVDRKRPQSLSTLRSDFLYG